MYRLFQVLSVAFLLSACSNEKSVNTVLRNEPAVVGLDGKEYFSTLDEKVISRLDSALQVAEKNLLTDSSEENFIWMGRRQAYLYQYNQAIETFSKGIAKYPESYKLYRHRGHRYITVRDYSRAIADLQQAAALMPGQLEIEPDGQPNKLNIPLSTTQFNVWYHLGLAHYLRGDLPSAARAYEKCLEVSNNDDLKTATIDWYYITLRRMGLVNEANELLKAIHDDMNIIENDSYYLRLKMYKGLIPADSVLNVHANAEDVDLSLATQGYGVGNWYLCNADTTKAIEIFKKVTAGKHFSAFGFIAAEADLVRFTANQ
jgi:tetratricopeptide (TPR) repeat protein